MRLELAFAGLVVGFLIGLTGVGSGALMAPVLLMIGVSPAVVVGTDIGFGLLTKLVGASVHVHQTTVNWPWVRRLACGTFPGALVGSMGVTRLAYAPDTLRSIIGVVLMLSALAAVLLELTRRRYPTIVSRMRDPSRSVVIAIGFVIGIIVGTTSVGTGSLVDVALVLFSPLAGAQLVGTGIVHAVLLSGVAATAHWRLGTLGGALIGALLTGSIPGVLLGCRIARYIPPQPLRWGVTALVFVSGFTTLSEILNK